MWVYFLEKFIKIFNMKRILYVMLILSFLVLPACADDVDMPSSGDLWDNWGSSQDFYGQDKPAVSDEEFDKAVQQMKDKQNKFGNWLKKRQIPKGEAYNPNDETEIIDNHDEAKAELSVLCIPAQLRIGDGVLPVGHYQVKGERDENGDIVLKLYQAQYLMAQIPAVETLDDFGEETISFVNWVTEGEDRIKIIFGSMDFNAYAVVELIE